MTLTTTTATARLTREIPAAEAAIDNALLQVNQALQTALAARQDTGHTGSEAHAVLLRMHRSLGELLDASGEMQRAHSTLVKIGVEVGTMDEPNCPDRHMASLPAEQPLRRAA